MHKTIPYPFSTDGLRKGSTVPRDVIEEAYGVQYGTEKFRLAVLQAKQYIVAKLSQRGETGIEIRERKGDLLILSPDAASEYRSHRFATSIRSAVDSHYRALSMPRNQMSPEGRDAHDKRVTIQGRVIGAIHEAHGLKPSPRERPDGGVHLPAKGPPTPKED